MEKKRTCRWATIGCGTIAHEMAQALQRLGRAFCAAAGRTPQKVRDFAAEFGIEKAYDTPAALFADPDIDIVYISTPHNTHAPYIMQALKRPSRSMRTSLRRRPLSPRRRDSSSLRR